MRNDRLGMRALTTIAAALVAATSLAACNTMSDPMAATDAAESKPLAAKNWWSVKPAASMSLTPASATLAVGSSMTLHVSYLDQRGREIPVDPARLTWFGCTVMETASVVAASELQYCENVASISPVYPGLRDVQVNATAPGLLQVWADDGFGHRVSAMITVQ